MITKLKNGASAIGCFEVEKDKWIVLAIYKNDFVVWHVDIDGNAYWGRYFTKFYTALNCFTLLVRETIVSNCKEKVL